MSIALQWSSWLLQHGHEAQQQRSAPPDPAAYVLASGLLPFEVRLRSAPEAIQLRIPESCHPRRSVDSDRDERPGVPRFRVENIDFDSEVEGRGVLRGRLQFHNGRLFVVHLSTLSPDATHWGDVPEIPGVRLERGTDGRGCPWIRWTDLVIDQEVTDWVLRHG